MTGHEDSGSAEVARGERLHVFTRVLQEKIRAHERATRHLNQYLSVEFNVFDYIGVGETALSRVLRDLLDPSGAHGQGATFLAAFLRKCGLSIQLPNDKVSTRVQDEMRTANIDAADRRIDLVIEIGDLRIGIENKPYARDQQDQVLAYSQDLSYKNPDAWYLVYLTPDGRPPSEYSVPSHLAAKYRASGRLIELSYAKDIAEWLAECIRECISDKYRWFLRDLHVALENAFAPHAPALEDRREH